MIRLLSLFTGIGAFEKALKNLKIPYELVGFSEIDKFAIQTYLKKYAKTKKTKTSLENYSLNDVFLGRK